MFNREIKKVFTVSPLLAEMQRRDDVFEKQADYLKIDYDKHTGPLNEGYLSFDKKHLNNMRNNIHNDEPNSWESKHRAAFVTQAHLDIIKYGKDSSYKNLCIFENDVLFHKRFHQIFNKAWWHLPEDWDILYLGAYYNYEDSFWITDNKKERTGLFKLEKGSLCSHGYVLNRSALEKFNDDFNSLVESGKFLIIDQFIGYATEYLGYKTFGILPKLVEQGYCGTPSLTLGLNQEIPTEFDYGDVEVREPHFEDNKSSNATKEDYTFIIHKHSKEKREEFNKKVDEAKKQHDKLLEDVQDKLYVTDETYNKRISICNDCDYLTKEGRCSKCGCLMKKKNKLKGFKCPKGYF